MEKTLIILGTRGIPAMHGGFETFAEKLSVFLKDRGWNVIVYCQSEKTENNNGKRIHKWHDITLIDIPVKGTGAVSTVLFDWLATRDSLKLNGLYLTLGYNTAIFNILHFLFRKKNVINMDGIEWKRQKWGFVAKSWFWLNEQIGKLIGTVLIADHPEIQKHLTNMFTKSKIKMIPYGGDFINCDNNAHLIDSFGIKPKQYYVVIARPEPENSILEIVKAFAQSSVDDKLVVLGNYDKQNAYHSEVTSFASQNILFPGAIYDKEIIGALRAQSIAYVHGHQVGGTNPSLVESMAAGTPVIAHDNRFNRWVVDDAGYFFDSVAGLQKLFKSEILKKERDSLSGKSISRVETALSWDYVLSEYEDCFLELILDE